MFVPWVFELADVYCKSTHSVQATLKLDSDMQPKFSWKQLT